MKRIEFEDKEATKTSSKPRKNCVIPADINDIKSAINENANINEYSTTELKIGKWGNEDLFRKRIEIAWNDLTKTSVTKGYLISVDITSLGADVVMVDQLHSYWLRNANEHKDFHNDDLGQLTNPLNFSEVGNNMNSSFNTFREREGNIYSVAPDEIKIFVGNDATASSIDLEPTFHVFDKLVLTLEYTKNS